MPSCGPQLLAVLCCRTSSASCGRQGSDALAGSRPESLTTPSDSDRSRTFIRCSCYRGINYTWTQRIPNLRLR